MLRRVVRFLLPCLVLSGWIAAPPARAQPASLRGFVIDRENGQPLELAHVLLRDEAGGALGATSRRDGQYAIPRIEPGRYVLQVSLIGYHAHADTLDFAPGATLSRNYELVPETFEQEEIVVQSERASGAARVTAGQQTIRPADLETVPMPDVSGDLASYLTTQPGIVSTGDRGGQLFIRGGEPSQNLVQLDGMTVYQPFHLLGFYSAFPADILQRADVYAGGFGSRFGERISSVLDVWTRPGNDRRFAGSASVSPFMSGVRLEGPILGRRASFLLSGRQSLVEHAAARVIDRPLPFTFGDAFAKLHVEPSDNSRAALSYLRTYDRGALGGDPGTALAQEIRWRNDAVGLRYLILPRTLSASADVRVSYSRMTNELGVPANPVRSSSVQHLQMSFDATFYGDGADVDVGIAGRAIRMDSKLGGLYQNVQVERGLLEPFAVYLEPQFSLGGLRLRPGVRVQSFNSFSRPVLEPRLRVLWALGAHQLSGAGGLYHQEVLGLSDRRDAAGVFNVWSFVPRPDPRVNDVRAARVSRAWHAILGYRVQPSAAVELSVEGFYKLLTDLYISEWTPYPDLTTRLQPARGRAAGFDVRLEWRVRPLYGFVNYGLSSTEYEARQEALRFWYGTPTVRFRPGHDRRHQVNAVVTAALAGFDLSVRWEFGSGLPFNRILGFDGAVAMDDLVDVSKVPSRRRVLYDDPFAGELPTYHRLDASVERAFDLGPATLAVQASVINGYDRTNLFYLDVFTLQRVDQLPLVPSLGLKVSFE